MIKIQSLVKKYPTKGLLLTAVDHVDLSIEAGEIFGIVGLSGAGKSTLLRSMNGLDIPTDGRVIVAGTDVTNLKGKALYGFRQKIGMIFQSFNLLSSRTVYGNIAFPLEIAGWKKSDIEQRVDDLLKWIDLEDKKTAYPSQLSGGQKQRVSIARALASNPQILLCDEATSALDPLTTKSILVLLRRINAEFGVTIVLITHEVEVATALCDRVAVMGNGRITALGCPKAVFSEDHDRLYKRTS